MWSALIFEIVLGCLMPLIECVTPSLLTASVTGTSPTPISLQIPTTRFSLTELKFALPPTTTSTKWKCPHVLDIPGVSCTCDLPHTVRCRGEADNPSSLVALTTNLARNPSNETENVSLLDLDIHNLRNLTPGSFQKLRLLGLVISTAGLTTIPSDTFTGLETTLAALGLPSNKMTSVPNFALKPLKKLQRLDLSNNNLTVLPSRAFPTLLMLHDLNLSGNGLRLLKSEVFVGLPKLNSLNLSNNQLDSGQLNERTLWGLRMLRELILSHNLLKGSITSTFIKGAPHLTYLNLSQNKLTSVQRNALEGCPKLRTLDLSKNSIEVIEDHAFHSLPDLENLNIAHNLVVAISGFSFSHMPKLEFLSLADNALRTVTADLIHQLPKLENLDLAANDITVIQKDVFNCTQNLQNLALAGKL